MKLLYTLAILLPALWLAGVIGCATNPRLAATAQTVPLDTPPPPATAVSVGGPNDSRRLEELWHQRTTDSFGSDFTLGPGDVLEISVPLEQLEHREARVSPQDTIELPLAGVVSVRGLNEEGLTEALRARLSKYMYDPPISLFVKHFGSREVAVVGAVQKPGLYTLTSGSDTLMDIVDRAGGMTTEAAARIIFIPAGAGATPITRASLSDATIGTDEYRQAVGAASRDRGGHVQTVPDGPVLRVAPGESARVAAVRPVATAPMRAPGAADLLGSVTTKLRPITISMAAPGAQQYLEMPARPGDALIIPAAGEVTVGGWVHNPGAYKITPGMTGLGSVSAAGGALFSSSAEILRTMPNGQRLSIPLDISAVQSGRQADEPVQSGDVVMVDPTAAGAVPYAIYEVFSKFGAGMMIPIP